MGTPPPSDAHGDHGDHGGRDAGDRHPGHHGHHGHTDPRELVALGPYRRDILAGIRPLAPVQAALAEAHGAVLAEDVTAAEDVPGFANSAVDGYAVRLEGFTEGTAVPVVGETAAGSAPRHEVDTGTTVRIMTGAPVPASADAVVPVELVDEEGGQVRFRVTPAAGENIRAAGESVRAGEVVLRAGDELDAPAVGMLAAVGRGRVMVHPHPTVAVLSTGDELVGPDVELLPGQIRDSNSWTLAAAVREAGASAIRVSAVADDEAVLRRAVRDAVAQADMLVSTGGVSAGRYDFVKRVLADLGDVRARKIGMKPGMPQAFGFVGSVPCFGLPGNPVSALVSFEVFVRPAIRRMQGRRGTGRPRITARLAAPVSSAAHKVEFVRVALTGEPSGWSATPTGPQGSGILRSMVEADGLAEIPADVTDLPAGAMVTVHHLGTW